MPFYPDAMNKARLRVAAVRLKPTASEGENHETAFLAGRYQHEMLADADIDQEDPARLEFWHADAFAEALAQRLVDVSASVDLLLARGPVSVN